MAIFRNIIKATDGLFNAKRCLLLSKSHFGSKVEVPSPPKKPLSAYMIFCKEKRKDILKINPSLTSPQQIKVLAEKWGKLTEEMKKPYELSARQSTQLYGEEHKKFYESLTEEQKEELARLKAKKMESRRTLRNKKALRDSGLPKAPNSAYTLFVQSEARKQSSITQASEFIKKVAESWKALPEESKKVFEKQAEEEKKRYVEEMKEWRSRMLLEGNKKILKAYEELKGRVLETDDSATTKKTRHLKSETTKN